MRSQTLRHRLHKREVLVVPAAYDMVSAKLIEITGFEAVYLSGFGQSASHLGLPDVGLMTMSEMAERVHNMARSVKIPVIADGDTGYGGIINVRRTIQEFEQVGAAGIQLEDQESPKKCGHTLGRHVVPEKEMIRKIEAAIGSRRSDDFIIIARTDARTTLGLNKAIHRGRLYEKAGADVIFVESPESKEELRQIAESFSVPVMANIIEGGRTPLCTVKELEKMGFKMVAFALTALLAAAFGVREAMRILKQEGSTQSLLDHLMDFRTFQDLIGFPDVWDFEKRFSH